MIKSDKWIREAAKAGMIDHFVSTQVSEVYDEYPTDNVSDNIIRLKRKVISYGVSSYGYDFRIADEFKIFTNVDMTIVDPKNFDNSCFVTREGVKHILIPPNSFALGRTIEFFRIPRNITAIALGKSTYARCGIVVNFTPFEAEWCGHATIEISNTTPLPAKIYANEGIGQLLFLESDDLCETSYADRKGKYQNQRGIVTARV